MAVSLKLPTIQNWNCHNCSGCCREHAIAITQEEQERIEKQGWKGEEGFGPGQPLFERYGGVPWKKQYRLAHREDGACVFLDENGLCRIHGKFGEAAKPLACRVYPYAFHPCGDKVTVSLRFSCPSVVANKGQPVSEQGNDLRTIARMVVPEHAREFPAPRVSRGEAVEWADFLRFVRRLDDEFAAPKIPTVVRLHRSLFWIGLVNQSRFGKLSGSRIDDLLEMFCTAAEEEFSSETIEPAKPSKLGRLQFRLLVAQYARKDTIVEVRKGMRGRLRLLSAAIRFARGKGDVPPLQDRFRPVPFETLESSYGPLPQDAEDIFSRYFRVKIQGLHFCGPAYYGIPLVEGFQSLALVFPVTMYLARWLAASDRRQTITTDDVAQALATVDHQHGYSPLFATFRFRHRLRSLATTGDIPKLCAWYGR